MSYFPPPVAESNGAFGETLTGDRQLLLHFTPQQLDGQSVFRIRSALTGSATLTTLVSSELRATTTASGTDKVIVTGHDNPPFYPGQWGEIGWSIRAPEAFTGNQFAEWGMMNYAQDTGVGWGVDVNGLYVWTVSNGSKTKVAASSFSADTLDGAGPSGLTWDETTVTKFTIEVNSTWWMGSVKFYAHLYNTKNEVQKVLAHVKAPTAGAIDSPTIGARPFFQLSNNATATARNILFSEFWTARSGGFAGVNYRTTAQFRFNLAPSTTPLPFVSFRKKTGYEDAPVYLQGFDIYTSDACLLYIRQNPTLSGDSWGAPNSTSATETAVEQDINATGTNSGVNRWTGVVGAGTTVFSWDEARHPKIYLYDGQIMSLYGRSMTGSIATLHCLLRVAEEW